MALRTRELIGSAGDLHAEPMPTEGDTAELWIMRPTCTSVVMGSAQRRESFDRQRLESEGIELAERRSGGGAVFIDPAETVWIDVLAPRSSDLWSEDLSQTFMTIGRTWQRALGNLGVGSELCDTAPLSHETSRIACWAGVGWGEVMVAGAKVVGLSQRRTRWGARIQSMAVVGDSAARVRDYLIAEQAAKVGAAIAVNHTPVLAAAGVSVAILETAILETF